MSEQTTPVNASNVVILDLKNLSGEIQFRVNINGELQWKLLTDSTWFTITNLELLRGRSITNVGVNVQNQFVLTFSDLTTQTLSIAALEDAITRATAAATQALASAGAAVAVAQGTATAKPSILPTKIFDFASTKMLPVGCSFTRNSAGSYLDKFGVIKYALANQPRFTHDGITFESKGILIEEARTNLCTNSTDCYYNSTLSRTVNYAKAPDGTNTAFLIQKTTTTNGIFSMVISNYDIGFYTRSLFVKANNLIEAKIVFERVGGPTAQLGGHLIFNVLNKTFSGTTTYPYSYGYKEYPNGWIRVWVTGEKSSTTEFATHMYLGGYGGTSANDNSVLIWGLQFEVGKSMTSYIPTVSSTVTREADILSINNNILNKDEGTIFCSGVEAGSWEKTNDTFRRILSLGGLDILSIINTINKITSYTGDYNTYSGFSNFMDKIALSYNSTARKLSANGLTPSTGTPISFSLLPLNIGSSGNSNFLNGTIKRIVFFSKMLSDVELVELTSKKLFGSEPNAAPTNGNLNELAYMDKATLLSLPSYNEFVLNGTGASLSMIIRRPYAFTFVLVESSSATFTSTPPAFCSANTDYTIAFTAPVGKQLVYAICPIFDI